MRWNDRHCLDSVLKLADRNTPHVSNAAAHTVNSGGGDLFIDFAL